MSTKSLATRWLCGDVQWFSFGTLMGRRSLFTELIINMLLQWASERFDFISSSSHYVIKQSLVISKSTRLLLSQLCLQANWCLLGDFSCSIVVFFLVSTRSRCWTEWRKEENKTVNIKSSYEIEMRFVVCWSKQKSRCFSCGKIFIWTTSLNRSVRKLN